MSDEKFKELAIKEIAKMAKDTNITFKENEAKTKLFFGKDKPVFSINISGEKRGLGWDHISNTKFSLYDHFLKNLRTSEDKLHFCKKNSIDIAIDLHISEYLEAKKGDKEHLLAALPKELAESASKGVFLNIHSMKHFAKKPQWNWLGFLRF